MDTRKVNKRTLGSPLVKAGCFDSFAQALRPDLPSDQAYQIRGALFAQLPNAVQAAEQQRASDNLGMIDLFNDIQEVTAPPPLHRRVWSDAEHLKARKTRWGCTLQVIRLTVTAMSSNAIPKTIGALGETSYGETALFAGLILDVANFGNRSVISLDDGTGRIEVSLLFWPLHGSKTNSKFEPWSS